MLATITSAAADSSDSFVQHRIFVRSLISSSRKIAQILQSGVSVILQSKSHHLTRFILTSLALIILDPFYRTLQGFMILVEKEWIQFAFPFCTRRKSAELKSEISERDIIQDGDTRFLPFLACVWHISQATPSMFEFNESLLLFLADQSGFGRFGTFLTGVDHDDISGTPDHSTENRNYIGKERLTFERTVKHKIASVWNYVDFHKDQFFNPLYIFEPGLINLNLRPNQFSLWNSYFRRYAPNSDNSNSNSNQSHP